MNQPKNILALRPIIFDTYTLCHMDDCIQDVSTDCEHLAYALNTIIADDPASQGVIMAVRSALLTRSEHASKMSAEIMGNLITQDEVVINE